MYPVTDRFLLSLRDSHKVKTVVDVYYNNALIQSNLPVVDGNIKVDRNAAVRRSGTITIGDPDFYPTFVTSPLAPYGAEVAIRTGIVYPEGTEELVSLGRFRIQEADAEQATGALPTLNFFDHSQRISDSKFLFPHDESGKTSLVMLSNYITQFVPNITFAIDPYFLTVEFRIPGGTIYDNDRWQACQDIAAAMGGEVFFDVDGNAKLVKIPTLTQSTPNSAAVWTVDSGANGVLVSAKRGVSRTGVYNIVACYGVQSNGVKQPYGTAWDSDPRSPTFYGTLGDENSQSVFGQSVYRMSSNVLTTDAQCVTAAQAKLNNFIGLARSLNFTCAPNPALDAGDIILVVYPNGTQELHLLDSVSIPLGAGGQFSATTRTLTYQLQGGT